MTVINDRLIDPFNYFNVLYKWLSTGMGTLWNTLLNAQCNISGNVQRELCDANQHAICNFLSALKPFINTVSMHKYLNNNVIIFVFSNSELNCCDKNLFSTPHTLCWTELYLKGVCVCWGGSFATKIIQYVYKIYISSNLALLTP